MIGQSISHYKILEKIGEGGMGVVYKAQDTNLDRIVALKFLPPNLSTSEQDKARFVQEAKAAATLNHPNICTIHDIQEHDGQMFLVMEFVDGQTLQERKSSLSLKQAIEIGIQIADGLAAAHEKGVVHRDVKPENIMIRKDGIAQIMDFGLAKLRAGRATRLTKQGSTVGTLGYMSPEQVQGLDVDHRSDIFSLGVVLYELFTGQMPFRGVHETALMYEIVNTDPAPMATIKPEIDPNLDAIVLDCLDKDPKERCQSAAEVARDLRRVKRESSRQRASQITGSQKVYQPSVRFSSADPSESDKRPPLAWIAVTAVFFLASLTIAIIHFRGAPHEVRTYRSSLLAPDKVSFVSEGGGHLALSPDGRTLAFVARDSTGRTLIWVRLLNAISGRSLGGTDGAQYPFWSPDSRFIGFFSGGKLKKIEASGGPPQIICDAGWGRGGTWNQNDVIVFSSSTVGPLSRVSAAGGLAIAVTKFDTSRSETSHRWPYFLPDGMHFVFLSRAVGEETDAMTLGSLDSTEKSNIILRATSNMTYAAGFLLFIRDQSLVAQRFDAAHLQITGDAFPIADQVEYNASFSRANFSASDNGALVYQTGVARGDRELVWIDRSGKRLGPVSKAGDFTDVRLSPDGRRVAVALFDPRTRRSDIWLYELARDLWTRFTFEPVIHRFPVWSPDGSRLAFSANRKGHMDIYQKSSSGAGGEESLLESNLDKVPTDWSSDGKSLAYHTLGDPKTKADSWILPLAPGKSGGEREPFLILQTVFSEGGGAAFSPDGKWIAYQSDESGKEQVYVRSVGGSGGKWQISTAGGTRPHWRRDGKELFYLSDDNNLTAAEVKAAYPLFDVGTIRPLFKVNAATTIGNIAPTGGTAYDVTGDGQRFLVNIFNEHGPASPITLVVGWDEELKKR